MDDWNVAPVFVVRDIQTSVDYYTDRLGFDVAGTFGEPMEMAFVTRGGVQLMLQDAEDKPTPGPNAAYKSVAWDALFWVADPRALHAELADRGATIVREPHQTHYGTLEVHVHDPDGHKLCFCRVSEAGDRR